MSATTTKLSLRQAARKLLARRRHGLTARQIIETLAERGWWESPAGKTPIPTLLAILHGSKGPDGDFACEHTEDGVLWTARK